ncbi:MAG: RagB/SusD family nutrient uptake outer membrane protein [Dysgonamonadaceae bacterium]|jgi:hypothetical protein|nr:RagB/SusD family nutrient uptake outer membrane protein [Dysgonamonadaceae bacterium]
MKSIKYILGSLSILLLVQCTDLEETPYTFLSPSIFYQTEEQLSQSLNGVYSAYKRAFGGENYRWTMYLEDLTEFGSPSYQKDDIEYWNAWSGINSASSRTFNIWDRGYDLINRANVVLGRGQGIEMDNTIKEIYFAEARLLRAATMFNMIRIYGGLAIPESFTKSLEGLEIPRKTVDETYAYIIADLEYAESKLPTKSKLNDIWRVSKGTAQALLGKVYLTRGSMTGMRDYLQKSKEYSNLVIQSNEYSLEPEFKNLWYWWNTNCKNGRESIFELQYGAYNGMHNNLHVQMGLNLNGDQAIGSYMYRRVGPSIAAYKSYSDQDKRKEGTFLTEIKFSNGTISFVLEDNGSETGSKGWKAAFPGNIKYYDRSEESFNLQLPRANIYVLRYAEVLLNYAEAENELNGSDGAYSAVNAVRNRAGLANLTTGLSQSQMADAIYRERGWEFIGEAQLYFDELRTDRISANLIKHWEDSKDIYLYKGWNLEFVPDKNFLWKIPQGDIDSNSALVQNPDNVSKR